MIQPLVGKTMYSHKSCWEDAIRNQYKTILILEGDLIFFKGWEQKLEQVISNLEHWEGFFLNTMGVISWDSYGVRKAENMFLHGAYMLKGEGITKYNDKKVEEKIKLLQLDNHCYYHFPFLAIQEKNDHVFDWILKQYMPFYKDLYEWKKITFSTCWYELKSKFPSEQYFIWMDNMLANVNNYYLVIYTNKEGSKRLEKYYVPGPGPGHPRIKVVIKNEQEFYNYKYKENWIENQSRNTLLKHTDWQLNMLWAEKISFVKETIEKKYFDTPFYGWCDIGYFRGGAKDTPIKELRLWPACHKLESLDWAKIHYAMPCKGLPILSQLKMMPHGLLAVAGGFFMLEKSKIEWWFKTFDEKLNWYFDNKHLVGDDQVIINHCVVENKDEFVLHEERGMFDPWFMFQRILS